MIIKTDAEMEAFRLGISIGARLPMRTVRAMYPGSLPYDTEAKRPLPWVKKNDATPEQHTSTDIPPDAPHGFGIRQPIGEDPADAPFNQSGRGHLSSQPEDSRRD